MKKIVINAEYGAFYIPIELIKAYDWNKDYICSDEIRSDPALIEWVEKNPDDELAIVYIPDNATEYYIEEYDGFETVLALINDKFVVELEPWEDKEY
mgnify:CR=1 FL=1